MELTVKHVLELTEFQDLQFIAGQGGLARPVTGVNIIEVPTVTHWMRGGEILFSSGYAFGGDDQVGCQLLKDLHEHKIAALVLKPGEYMVAVSSALKECAEALDFPLFTMPQEQPYSHYMDAVYALLLNQKAKTLEVSNTICNHLFNIAIDDSYEPLSQFVSESLQRPIYLLDGEGIPINGTKEDPAYRKYTEAFASITKRSAGQDGFVNEFVHEVEGQATRFLYVPIESVQKRVTYLVSVDCDCSDHELCCSVLPFVARIIQAQEMHQYSMLQHGNRIAGDLLGDIIEERFEDPGIIIQRGKLLHIDLTKDLIMLVIQIINKQNQTDALGSRDEHQDYKLRSLIREAILAIEPHALFLDRDDSVVCLLQVEAEGLHNLKDKMKSLILPGGLFRTYSLNVGISRQAQGISSVPSLFRQAEIAGKVAKARHDPETSFCFYDELGLFRLYPELAQSGELPALIEDVLRPILDYDHENRSDYMRVLRAFYENNGVIARAADSLFIHKNTMIKYLNALETITQRDLRDYRSVVEVMFCLQYYDLMNG